MDLEVTTLNCWGLLIISSHRRARIKYLAEYLRSQNTSDVVVLQEVWVSADAKLLMEAAAEGGLTHSMHFRSGVFGSGLVTMSRYPIVESGFWRYQSSGDPAAIFCGDFYAGKGFGWVRINTPCGPVDVFNTHLHANYSHKCKAVMVELDEGEAVGASAPMSPKSPGAASVTQSGTAFHEFKVPGDMAAGYRVSQMLELVQVMRHVSKWGSVGLVLGGDLNCKPDFLESCLLRTLMPELKDSWQVIHKDEAGHTCKAASNTFQPRRQVSERIDYVLTTLTPTSSDIVLQMTPAGYSYSDHFAVKAKLTMEPLRSDPATLLVSPRGSSGLNTDSFSGLKPNTVPPPDLVHRRAVVFKSAQGVLSRGVMLNGRNASVNLGLAAVVLLLAIALGLHMALSGPPAGHSALPMTVLLPRALGGLLSLTLAVFATFFFIMGFIADSTQHRVLQQANAQLNILLASN